MPIVNGKPKILLMFALVVLVTGIGLAIAQPGSLGGDDDDEAAQGSETTTSVDDTDPTTDDGASSTTSSSTSSTSTTSSTVTTTAPAGDDGTTTTTVNEVEDSETTNTTQPGSGLGSSGAAQPGDTDDGLAATGGESLLLAGVALGTAGLAARRRQLGAR